MRRVEEIVRKIFALDPDSVHGHRMLGLVAMSRGNVRDGMKRLRRVIAADPNDVESLTWLCAMYLFTGLGDEARRAGVVLEKIDPFSIQSLAVRMGVPMMERNEIFAPLRADPRFIEMLRRMREASESLARELVV